MPLTEQQRAANVLACGPEGRRRCERCPWRGRQKECHAEPLSHGERVGLVYELSCPSCGGKIDFDDEAAV